MEITNNRMQPLLSSLSSSSKILKNFWYGIEHSVAISTKPKTIKFMGHDLVLYRGTEGQIIALDGRCVHRGSELAAGWVEGNCIHCPYHGWRYESDGVCSHIPANQPDVSIPKRARLQSYPVQEKYGLVWLFWGDLPVEECPPIPPLKEFDESGWRSVHGDFAWDGHYTRVLANTIDMAHAPFVHATAFGNKQEPMVQAYKLEQGEWSASGFITFETKPAYSLKFILGNDPPAGVFRATFYMPNVSRVDLQFGKFQFVLFLVHLPVNETKTITKWLHIRNFVTTPLADSFMRRDVVKTFVQDNNAVKIQAGAAPQDLTAEIHAPSDALELAYRKFYNQAVQMGWS
ncbi:aromatic ring-hydroxylating dioxygenase subunit alpha [Pseudanabaena biceps]|nr:aromatic ring-hydroxylating dioxygenase subunit alpha [Pseudanabaena biceps]